MFVNQLKNIYQTARGRVVVTGACKLRVSPLESSSNDNNVELSVCWSELTHSRSSYLYVPWKNCLQLPIYECATIPRIAQKNKISEFFAN